MERNTLRPHFLGLIVVVGTTLLESEPVCSQWDIVPTYLTPAFFGGTMIRRMLASFTALGATAALSLPASAQAMSSAAPSGGGGSLLYVWGWILIAGIIIFVGGASLGVGGSGRR